MGRRTARGMAEEFHALLGGAGQPAVRGWALGRWPATAGKGKAKVLEPLSAGPVSVSSTCIPSAGRLVLMDRTHR